MEPTGNRLMRNSDSTLLSDRLQILIKHEHFLITDRFDHAVIGEGSLEHNNFSISIQPESQNLGVATEACHCLFSQYIQERPISASFSTANVSAIALCSKLGFEPVSNARNTVTVSCDNRHHDPHYESALVGELWQQLGINADTLGAMPRHHRSCQLVAAGSDVFSRPSRMHPKTWRAYKLMVAAAQTDGIQLDVVSSYRDYDYQADLIRNKLSKGQRIEDILKVNAAPGYSEHHTGRALDLTTPGFEPLSEHFEASPAFEWLTQYAQQFGFHMSYPRGNAAGIIYEPWHWCFRLSDPRDA